MYTSQYAEITILPFNQVVRSLCPQTASQSLAFKDETKYISLNSVDDWLKQDHKNEEFEFNDDSNRLIILFSLNFITNILP